MKVILQQDVKGQGKKGQLVNVSDGYARNFLLPKKLAVIATAENVNTMKQQEKARKAQEAAEKAEAEALSEKLKGLTGRWLPRPERAAACSAQSPPRRSPSAWQSSTD